MWNFLDLKCPKSDIVEYQPQEMVFAEELQDIVTTLTMAADTLTSENPLWEELYVLRNIQVKYKRILRCDKCLVYLHRVSHCLKKMVLLNLSKSYLDLAERFLVGFSIQDSSISLQLPSRQQIEFILLRTLSAAKLICDGIKYSRETFCYLLQKIKVGHNIIDLVTAGSVTARLIVLLNATLERICSMYQTSLAWLYKLKKGTYEWPEKLNLPQDLKKWLEANESEILKPLPMSQDDMKLLSSLMKTKYQNKDSDTDSIIVVNEVDIIDKGVSKQAQNGNDNDYGEVIPRKKAKKAGSLSIEQKTLLKKIIHVQNLENLEDVWNDINRFSGSILPKTISNRKQEIICKLFLQIRRSLTIKNSNKKLKQPIFLKNALSVFSKHLGFTHDQIEMCQDEPVSNRLHSPEVLLEPVKTLKELRALYKQLCSILEFSNEFEKQRKLQKIFKRRRTDIRLLRQNGEKNIAKKLIFCTSKVFLTLFKK